jgi:hypothetical protein
VDSSTSAPRPGKLEQSFDDATAAIKTERPHPRHHTQKGRDNQAALDDIATSAQTSRSRCSTRNGPTSEVAASMAAGRKHYIAVAVAMGMDEGKARDLAKALFGIPKDTTPHIRLTAPASRRLLDALAALDIGRSTRCTGRPSTCARTTRRPAGPRLGWDAVRGWWRGRRSRPEGCRLDPGDARPR